MFSAKTVAILLALYEGGKADDFNYGATRGDNYGPSDWSRVRCGDLDTCEGWPDKHESSIGWRLEDNQCRWCPETGNKCAQNHRMSPVNLVRDRAIEGNPNWKDCPDWHWMNFEDGSCRWEDMEDSFEISKHALQIHTPMRRNGDINCANADGERLYPRLDYSKGFPDWWHLDRTDIKTPSEHTQHGKRYAAEVTLAHFYELDHWKNQIGYVTLFMQDYPNQEPWHYLDKLICKFRREEEKKRVKCGLPPAPVYKMCELYRGQERTAEDLEFAEGADTSDESNISDQSQINRPNPIPLEDFGGNPDAKVFPLQLCQGDCDFTEDCAVGLICHRREANEAVPGCIGGEEDSGSSDYCVFDPFGPGYNVPTSSPTNSPTGTPSPTIRQLPPKPAVDFGGDPPADVFPLQRCQGDCDIDEDCDEGLICFQRLSNQAIPGCIGGESNPMVTDYCVLDPLGDGYVELTTSPTAKPTSVPTGVPTVSPTTSPIAAPTEAPVGTKPPTNMPTSPPTTKAPVSVPRPIGPPKPLSNRGWEPNFLLDECEGDCDEDDDCMPGLVCFNREASLVAVPGCLGGEQDGTLTDYCVYPEIDQSIEQEVEIVVNTESPTKAPTVSLTASPTASLTASPTASQTASPTASQTASPTASATNPFTTSPTEPPVVTTDIVVSPKFDDEPVRLNGISWSPPKSLKPLDLCQGDCDIDSDCGPGLMCFQRFTPRTPVPGCIGGEDDTSLMDYCIIDTGNSTEPAFFIKPSIEVGDKLVGRPIPDISATQVPQTQVSPRNDVPPPIDCKVYDDMGVNMNRFCDNDHVDMCCKSPRSDSNYCHENYGIFGDDIHSVCHHCCQEVRGESYQVGEPNAPKDGLEPFTNEECSKLDNSARICKEQSCCDPKHADTQYCREQISDNREDWERICWSCCHPSKSFSSESSRLLLESAGPKAAAKTEEELRLWHRENPRKLGAKDVTFNHTSMHRELIVREENFVEKGLKDEDAYFQELHNDFQRRQLQVPVMENYEDVHWWPYEWLLKVGTEYYYRYEGSMTVPPCYTVNHWRVMKDPIRVAKHQITELERLLAWRMNGQCEASTAGKSRKDNPDAVDVNRPLQELQKGHRMVFCECQDWPSKFPQERAWCEKWQKRDPELRLFENPYNWEQQGF
mmetsp:Transcript_28487/g.77135  ORF Transcript_28487/g.77135 Transcript_28487/m.77135 type:complete len:1149 (+) Transcript_28487:390-3836(+)